MAVKNCVRLTMVQTCKLHDFMRNFERIDRLSASSVAAKATSALGFKVGPTSVALLAREFGINIRRNRKIAPHSRIDMPHGRLLSRSSPTSLAKMTLASPASLDFQRASKMKPFMDELKSWLLVPVVLIIDFFFGPDLEL